MPPFTNYIPVTRAQYRAPRDGARKPCPKPQAQQARSLWRLVRCVRALGLSKGVRYWRIENLCIAQPAFALQWADALESEALSHEANGVTQYAPSLRGFAADIRRHHAAFTANVEMTHAHQNNPASPERSPGSRPAGPV